MQQFCRGTRFPFPFHLNYLRDYFRISKNTLQNRWFARYFWSKIDRILWKTSFPFPIHLNNPKLFFSSPKNPVLKFPIHFNHGWDCCEKPSILAKSQTQTLEIKLMLATSSLFAITRTRNQENTGTCCVVFAKYFNSISSQRLYNNLFWEKVIMAEEEGEREIGGERL